MGGHEVTGLSGNTGKIPGKIGKPVIPPKDQQTQGTADDEIQSLKDQKNFLQARVEEHKEFSHVDDLLSRESAKITARDKAKDKVEAARNFVDGVGALKLINELIKAGKLDGVKRKVDESM